LHEQLCYAKLLLLLLLLRRFLVSVASLTGLQVEGLMQQQ
jgi:hypothetical protein